MTDKLKQCREAIEQFETLGLFTAQGFLELAGKVIEVSSQDGGLTTTMKKMLARTYGRFIDSELTALHVMAVNDRAIGDSIGLENLGSLVIDPGTLTQENFEVYAHHVSTDVLRQLVSDKKTMRTAEQRIRLVRAVRLNTLNLKKKAKE